MEIRAAREKIRELARLSNTPSVREINRKYSLKILFQARDAIHEVRSEISEDTRATSSCPEREVMKNDSHLQFGKKQSKPCCWR